MAQLKDLLVSGKSSFLGTVKVNNKAYFLNTIRIGTTDSNPALDNNWCEGIRINAADGRWVTIALGTTGETGTNDYCWSIHRTDTGNFSISKGSSDGVNGLFMTCNNGAKMGLGTTNPQKRLHVNGDIMLQGTLFLQRQSGSGCGRINFYSQSYNNWVEYMSNRESGACPTGGTPAQLGNVTTWARRSIIENIEGYGWIWESTATTIDTDASTVAPTARMALSSNNGTLTVTGPIKSGSLPGAWVSGCNGNALVNSTMSPGGFSPMLSGGTTNGRMVLAFYTNGLQAAYITKDNCDKGINNVSATAMLMDESGSGSWPGSITAETFNGALNGNASSASRLVSRGNVNCETGTTLPAVSGLSMSQVYGDAAKYPCTYGNVMTLAGGGHGQLLIGWSGTSGANAPVYVRSKRDVPDANWSSWQQLATTDGSIAYATSAGNADTVDGKHFHWSGQEGQPTWMWGGNDGINMYVYNPSKFNVNSAAYPAGFASRSASIGWGTLTATNGYNYITDWHFSGGDVAFAEKGGQTSFQIDGYFYQNEGSQRVLDISSGVTLNTAQTITALKTMNAGLTVSGRVANDGDDEGIVIGFAPNGYAGLTLGSTSAARSVFYFKNDGSSPFWRYNNGSANYDLSHPGKAGTIAVTSDIIPLLGWWNNSDTSKHVDNLAKGVVFSYTTHGAPSHWGTTVAFTSGSNDAYVLQLHGTGDNYLWFRNKSSDYGQKGWLQVQTTAGYGDADPTATGYPAGTVYFKII